MKRSLAITIVAGCLSLVVSGQNLVQNPGFEYNPGWDSLWVLELTKPSTRTAVATLITTDAHEGTNCVELSNTDDGKWTYFNSDVVHAPIRLLAGRSYEVKGWIRSVELGKEAKVTFIWDNSRKKQVLYNAIPDPVTNPDWFMVIDTIAADKEYNDGYLSLGFKSDKGTNSNVVGKLRYDDFSVTLIPDGTETNILAFSFPEQISPENIDHDLGTIDIEVPYGTDLSALAPDNIEIYEGAIISPAAGVPRDFTNPVVYTVTARNGVNTRDWTVTVVAMPPGTATGIISFTIPELVVPAAISSELHIISGRASYGTDVSALVPIIEIPRGASIDPESGVPADFSSPVIYTVTAEDGITEQEWVVVILVEPNTATDITSFEIPELLEPAIIDTSRHTVTGHVLSGTDRSNLVPTIAVSDGAVINPASGTVTDFSIPVTYTVTAEDRTTVRQWLVTIEAVPGSETDITEFSLAEQTGISRINNVDHTVETDVVFGTDITSLTPAISVSPGATIAPASGTARDFTNSVEYLVTAFDGLSSQVWTVTVLVVPPGSETEIISFSIPELVAPASISKELHFVSGKVSYGTDINALVPDIEISRGASIDPESGIPGDFSSPVIYTITAEDGITVQEWVVVILVAPNTETDIISFEIPELIAPATIVNSLHTITGTVPSGTDLRYLVPSIAVSDGAEINPASGTVTDFSTPVTYTVTAEDGTTVQHWYVAIEAIPGTEADITGFSLPEQTGTFSIIYVDHTIETEVAYGTDVTSLTPTISVSPGAVIEPASGVTLDFTNSVEYLVTAGDGLTSQVWTVTVLVEPPNSEAAITSFLIPELSVAATIIDSLHTVVGTVPTWTDLTALVPNVEISKGATIQPESGKVTDFTSPINYRVTAEDGTTFQDWLVSIGFDPATGTENGDAGSFRIYPNPATDAIFFECPGETNLRLYDLMGKLCYSEDRVKGTIAINVSNFERGTYIIRLVREDGTFQQQEVILQ